jgi:CubicO group peptidase (beta-lactamase class C family)
MKQVMKRIAFRSVSIVVLFAIATAESRTAQVVPSLSAEKISKIEAVVTSMMSARGIPALSIAVVTDNKLSWQKGFGIADLENSIPAKTSTVYRIASVSKAITAVAAMQLVERGKLDLDAPVQKYAPSFPVKTHPINTRQLLSHLSGIRHYKRGEGERTQRYERLTDALSIFKDDPLEHEPETRFTYSTYAYTLLGVVIEGASGMTYQDYMREHIFKPAGMTHTQPDDNFIIIANRARGYSPRVYGVFNGEVRNAQLLDSSYKIPGGGLVSTAEDLAKFALASQNGTLIKQATFEQMTKRQKTRDGQETTCGYAWFVDGREGRPPDGSVWHGGVQAGFTADLWMLPNKRFALVMLTNLEGGGRLGLGILANQVAEIVLQ